MLREWEKGGWRDGGRDCLPELYSSLGSSALEARGKGLSQGDRDR